MIATHGILSLILLSKDNNMLPEKVIYIAVLINLIGIFFYMKSMFQEQAKPNLVSWIMWMLAPMVAIFFQLKAGAGLSVLPVFMAGFGPLLVIIFSLIRKNGYWKINSFDIICGALSMLALVIYIFTKNLGLAIIFAIFSDLLAGIPTIVKSWKHPESEYSFLYLVGIFANIIGLLVIREWTFAVYSFGIYLVTMNIIIWFSINHKKFLREKITSRVSSQI